jgi:S-ribosylhomocysteine lyase LuxS involved in autoinducer biosynthesis
MTWKIVVEHLGDVPKVARTRCGMVKRESLEGVRTRRTHKTPHTASSKHFFEGT